MLQVIFLNFPISPSFWSLAPFCIHSDMKAMKESSLICTPHTLCNGSNTRIHAGFLKKYLFHFSPLFSMNHITLHQPELWLPKDNGLVFHLSKLLTSEFLKPFSHPWMGLEMCLKPLPHRVVVARSLWLPKHGGLAAYMTTRIQPKKCCSLHFQMSLNNKSYISHLAYTATVAR